MWARKNWPENRNGRFRESLISNSLPSYKLVFMVSTRKAIPLLFIAVTFAACLMPVEAQQDDQTKAKVFIEIAENVRGIALEFMKHADATGTDISLATAYIEEGNIILGQARAAYERGEYSLAVFHARMAQREFRNALRNLGPESPPVEEQEEELLETLKRARETILRIRSTLSSSTGIDLNLREQINANLDRAENLLNEADSLLRLQTGDTSQAALKLDQSEKLIVESFMLLKYASEELNKQRMESFLINLEEEIARLRDELGRLEMTGVNVDDLEVRLDMAARLIELARHMVSEDQLAEALLDIQQVSEIIRQMWEEIATHQTP